MAGMLVMVTWAVVAEVVITVVRPMAVATIANAVERAFVGVPAPLRACAHAYGLVSARVRVWACGRA
eukprot:6192071-Pleurochrysis_carterae.AAC.3